MKLFQRKSEDTSAKNELDELYVPDDFVHEEDAQKSDEDKQFDEIIYSSVDSLDCFGWKEEKTDKWLIKCADFWYLVVSFGWFLFGAITFAPVIFISHKVNVIFKDKKKSLICGVAIHAVVLAIFAILSLRK